MLGLGAVLGIERAIAATAALIGRATSGGVMADALPVDN
jgi:DNA-binding transcriptional regulator YdaS (Cro superfamily)